MLKHVKYRLKKFLPVEADAPENVNPDARKIVTLSLKRSGQHAVINWLCSQAQDIVHFNHCCFERRQTRNYITPVNNRVIYYTGNGKHDTGIQGRTELVGYLSEIGRYNSLIYSFEDYDIENSLLQNYIHRKQPTVILILRDPYNWLASTFRRRDCDQQMLEAKMQKLVKYLEQALSIKNYMNHEVCAINYNKWTMDREYRKDVCSLLDLPFSAGADKAIEEIPDFGGGSSFKGMTSAAGESKEDYFERWKEYLSDPLYLKLLDDKYLVSLVESFFQISKPF